MNQKRNQHLFLNKMPFYLTCCSFKSTKAVKKRISPNFLILKIIILTTSVYLEFRIRHTYMHLTYLLYHFYKTNIKMYTTWNEKMKCHTKHSLSENLGVFCVSEMHMLSQGS